jgi:AraC-like DNA-binding protein
MATSCCAHLVSASSALPGEGPSSAVVAAVSVALVVVLTAVVVLRERQHTHRRRLLESQLGDLERALVSLSIQSSIEQPAHGDDASLESGSTPSADEIRGPLSTAISTLRHDVDSGLPSPDRIDLRATLFVYEHVDRPTTPADLAGGLNLSLRTVQRGLSSSLGCTPRELILAVKMREAKRMLVDDDCRVQEAARAVGFDDPFHFSRRFKTYYGLSPTEMQDRARRNVA